MSIGAVIATMLRAPRPTMLRCWSKDGRKCDPGRAGPRERRAERKWRAGGHPCSPLLRFPWRLFGTKTAPLWGAVGGNQACFLHHQLGAGGAEAGSFEIRPGLLRAIL